MDRNDLRRTAEFASAAMSARTSADVAALVRRLRHVLASDDVHVWSIAAGGAVEWQDPDDGAPGTEARDERDGRSLAWSETTSFGVVHVVTHRRRRPFRSLDRTVLSLVSPYLVAAVTAVDGRAARRSGGRQAALPVRDEPLDVVAGAGSDVPGASLTSREVQILSSVARGATNKEVAADLDISPRTVQKHLEHIYDKLGVRRRTAAAGWWSDRLAAG